MRDAFLNFMLIELLFIDLDSNHSHRSPSRVRTQALPGLVAGTQAQAGGPGWRVPVHSISSSSCYHDSDSSYSEYVNLNHRSIIIVMTIMIITGRRGIMMTKLDVLMQLSSILLIGDNRDLWNNCQCHWHARTHRQPPDSTRTRKDLDSSGNPRDSDHLDT
jgi:hypothetical protein